MFHGRLCLPRVERCGCVGEFGASEFSREFCDAVGSGETEEVARVCGGQQVESSVFHSAGDESCEVGWAVKAAMGWKCVGHGGASFQHLGNGRKEIPCGAGHYGNRIAR